MVHYKKVGFFGWENKGNKCFCSYLLPFVSSFLSPAYVVRREGNSFTLFVSPHLAGGVPIFHNALQHFPKCHGAGGVPWPGGTLAGVGGYPARGVPC